MPICWPSSPITRTSRARMRSLMRIKRLSIQSSCHFPGRVGCKIIAWRDEPAPALYSAGRLRAAVLTQFLNFVAFCHQHDIRHFNE